MQGFENFIKDKVRDYEEVVGLKPVEKPPLICFKNTITGIQLLYKHIKNKSQILIHADVDVDGLGSAYVMRTFLMDYGLRLNTKTVINKTKEHGISQRHVDYINNMPFDLLIIVDSGSNDIEYIKQLNCDVLVLDHHELSHNELTGKTQKGNYVIINNMTTNDNLDELKSFNATMEAKNKPTVEQYISDEDMSGCLVVYEFLRVFEAVLKLEKSNLETRKLYQWVGVTLLTDVISTGNKRNQWYMEKTVLEKNIENCLNLLIMNLNSYQEGLDKGFINFTLAPTFNRAIRAGASAKALNVLINVPQEVEQLAEYKQIQENIVSSALNNVNEFESYCLKDISNENIDRNYAGLLATKITDTKKKNTIVYKINNGYAEGSFRGRCKGIISA